MDAIHLIDALTNLSITMRNEVDWYHDRWYIEAVALADNIFMEETMPRTFASKQKHRDNPPASTPFDYFKMSNTIPLVYHLNLNLKTRFDFSTINSYYGLGIAPSRMISMSACFWFLSLERELA